MKEKVHVGMCGSFTGSPRLVVAALVVAVVLYVRTIVIDPAKNGGLCFFSVKTIVVDPVKNGGL